MKKSTVFLFVICMCFMITTALARGAVTGKGRSQTKPEWQQTKPEWQQPNIHETYIPDAKMGKIEKSPHESLEELLYPGPIYKIGEDEYTKVYLENMLAYKLANLSHSKIGRDLLSALKASLKGYGQVKNSITGENKKHSFELDMVEIGFSILIANSLNESESRTVLPIEQKAQVLANTIKFLALANDDPLLGNRNKKILPVKDIASLRSMRSDNMGLPHFWSLNQLLNSDEDMRLARANLDLIDTAQDSAERNVFLIQLSLIPRILISMNEQQRSEHLALMKAAAEIKQANPNLYGFEAFAKALEAKYGRNYERKLEDILSCE